jgi:CheY-like chemotaxis protein
MVAYKHIFLVEDDEEDQQIFFDAITDIDASILITCAANGVDALAKLIKMQLLPDIIFMDVNMPFMNGFECLAKIKAQVRLQNVPVVMLTSAKKFAAGRKGNAAACKLFFKQTTQF